MDHLFHYEDPGMQVIRWLANANLEQDLYWIGIIPQLVPLFVKILDNGSNISTLLNVERFQAFQMQKLIGPKWTILGMSFKEWHHLLHQYKHWRPSHHGSPK